MLHLATSSPCSRSKIYAFDNKSKENQKFLNNLPHLQKIGTKDRPGMWPFRLLKASFKHLFQRLAEWNSRVCGFVCVCGSGKASSQNPTTTKCQLVGGQGAGKRNGKCGAYFNQCARGKKEAKLPRQQMSKVSNERFLLSKKGRFVGRLGSGILCGTRGRETWFVLGYLICWFYVQISEPPARSGSLLRLKMLSNAPPLRGGPMVVVCVLLLYTHNNSSVTLCFFSVNIIVVRFHYHT